MSLIPANIEYLAFAYQADKTTAATEPDIACVLTDCALEPGVQSILTPESDRSAQQGNKIVVGAQPGGTFKKYMRPNEEDFFLKALLGISSSVGMSSPYTHTINVDPDAPFVTPYLTVWDVWPGVATIKYTGVRIGEATYSGQPGQGIEADYTLVGLKAELGAEEPDPTGLIADEEPHTWAELTAMLDDEHPGTVNQFSLKIDRGTNRFQGDNLLETLDNPNGLLAVTGSLEIAFEDDELLRAANTGAVDGTGLTTTIFEMAISIALARGDDDIGVALNMALAQISNYKVALKTDASPAIANFDFNSKRSDDITETIQAIVINSAPFADRVDS